MDKKAKEIYEKPMIEVIEFLIDDHIALSGNGAMEGESIWGGSQ